MSGCSLVRPLDVRLVDHRRRSRAAAAGHFPVEAYGLMTTDLGHRGRRVVVVAAVRVAEVVANSDWSQSNRAVDGRHRVEQQFVCCSGGRCPDPSRAPGSRSAGCPAAAGSRQTAVDPGRAIRVSRPSVETGTARPGRRPRRTPRSWCRSRRRGSQRIELPGRLPLCRRSGCLVTWLCPRRCADPRAGPEPAEYPDWCFQPEGDGPDGGAVTVRLRGRVGRGCGGRPSSRPRGRGAHPRSVRRAPSVRVRGAPTSSCRPNSSTI